MIGKCAADHFFEDDPAFDRELIFSLPSILMVTKKEAYNF